ncbi:type III secretion system inner rod subunit SctI [Pseudomonas sp. LRF_L74]|uniref:type III secretion system inner rod subunit SctI n=1 Tax=Pseudomonas sp. LRF_L74 TaxID=3369422 RepID=UPI003F5F42AB
MSIAKIDDLRSVAKSAGPDLDQGLVSEPSRHDVELFSNLMQEKEADPSQSGAMLAEAIGNRMASIDKLSDTAKRSMKEAVIANDPGAIADMSRALSQYSLQMAITTKVVSKGGQALEKLTNMQ